MDVHAERQLIKTAELSDQIQAVQADVRGVAANIRATISGREEDTRQLAEIRTAVDDVRIVLAHLDARQCDTKHPATVIDDGNQAQIFQALEEIQAMLKGDAQNCAVEGGAEAVPETVEQPSASFPAKMEPSDLADILQKLDMLVELSVRKPDSVSSDDPPMGPRRDAPLVRPTSIFVIGSTDYRVPRSTNASPAWSTDGRTRGWPGPSALQINYAQS